MKNIAERPFDEVHFGGPDLPAYRLRDLLAERIAAVPSGGAIDWVTYYFRDRRLAEALLRAHRRGVKVTVTLEKCPRTTYANETVTAILSGQRGLGSGFRSLSLRKIPIPFGIVKKPRLHEKLYCFSHPSPTAFIGSFNPSGDGIEDDRVIIDEIGDQDRGHNVLVGLTDPVLVGRLVEHARLIHRARCLMLYRFSKNANQAVRGKDTEIHFWPRVRPHPVLQFLSRLGAKARIRIAASHMKGASVVKAITGLAYRGAAVEILAEPTLRRVPVEVERMLTQAGISFRRVTHPEGLPMHNKFVLAEKGDQRWVMFGSFNWTDRSYWLNHEIGAISTNEHLCKAFASRWEVLAVQRLKASVMTISPSTLIIPVKMQVREMDAKLLLGCIAVESGFPVIIGSKAFLHFLVDSIPRGVYLAKSIGPKSIPIFDILRKLGHEIVAWDNDLLREPDPEYYRKRLSPSTMRQVSHLIAWGPDNASIFRKYPGYHGAEIHITGNARVDLLRPELRELYREDADAIRERFGNFVLVSTNFSKVDHFSPELSEFKKAMAKDGSDAANRFDIGKGRHKLALFNHFQEMLPLLCKSLDNSNVVVRPHPAENPSTWHAIAARCDNLHVANDGSVTPWLMAAQALIANSCTTQVEAAVLGTPTVNYQPVKSEMFDFELPGLVSRCVFSVDELCTTVRAIVKEKIGPLDYAERRKILDRHIAGLDGPLAAERIIQVLEAGGYNKRQPPATSLNAYAHGWIQNHLRTTLKRINMHRPGYRNNLSYHAHLFPDISVPEIMRKIACMGRLLNRFESIKVTQISKHIFRISG